TPWWTASHSTTSPSTARPRSPGTSSSGTTTARSRCCRSRCASTRRKRTRRTWVSRRRGRGSAACTTGSGGRGRFGALQDRVGEYEANDYWAAVAIPYKPFYAFEETLAVFGDAPRSPLSLLGAYERLTSAITDGRVRALGAMSEETRLT